jgi:hypothetical protein
MQPVQFCSLDVKPFSTGIGHPQLSTLPTKEGQGTEHHQQGRDHHQFQRLNQTIDTQQQLISQLLQAQKMLSVSLPSMKKSSTMSTTPTPATPENPHRSLHTGGDRRPTAQEVPPSRSTSAVTTTQPQTPPTDDDDED